MDSQEFPLRITATELKNQPSMIANQSNYVSPHYSKTH
jgi:hypothetical protein